MMNPILKPIVLAMATELQRQHDQSGFSGLVVSATDEPHVLQVNGPSDLELLAQVVWDVTLTQADKTVHDIVRDMTQPNEPVRLQTYLYDCDRGQGSVMATSLEQARRKARLEAGSLADVNNLHLATSDELAFRKVMGGDNV